jgi:hypothetical protein
MLGSFGMQNEYFAMKYTRLLALVVFPSLCFAEDNETVTPYIQFEKAADQDMPPLSPPPASRLENDFPMILQLRLPRG